MSLLHFQHTLECTLVVYHTLVRLGAVNVTVLYGQQQTTGKAVANAVQKSI